jgi:hypothetical protein
MRRVVAPKEEDDVDAVLVGHVLLSQDAAERPPRSRRHAKAPHGIGDDDLLRGLDPVGGDAGGEIAGHEVEAE